MSDERDDPGGILVPPPILHLGSLLAGLALQSIRPVPFLPRGASRSVGWPLLAGGTLLAGWFARTMRRAGTPFGLDEPATRLVTDGPFRHSRNPGYLSFALIHAGAACLTNALWALLPLPVVLFVVQRQAIEKEERYLDRAFGDEYRRYKAHVRRWI